MSTLNEVINKALDDAALITSAIIIVVILCLAIAELASGEKPKKDEI